jgi:hypothetical protein
MYYSIYLDKNLAPKLPSDIIDREVLLFNKTRSKLGNGG